MQFAKSFLKLNTFRLFYEKYLKMEYRYSHAHRKLKNVLIGML